MNPSSWPQYLLKTLNGAQLAPDSCFKKVVYGQFMCEVFVHLSMCRNEPHFSCIGGESMSPLVLASKRGKIVGIRCIHLGGKERFLDLEISQFWWAVVNFLPPPLPAILSQQ